MLVVVLGCAFYTGFLEGKRSDTQQVVLSCNNNILSKLSIPLATLANGVTANAATGQFVGSKNGANIIHQPVAAGAKAH